MMADAKDLRHEALAKRSETVYGNRHVLPVAVWILESGETALSQPVVSRGLDGRSPPNKVLHALTKLSQIGAVIELPFGGRPDTRRFDKRESSCWDLIAEYVTEVDMALASP
jgi:hypothetical protein